MCYLKIPLTKDFLDRIANFRDTYMKWKISQIFYKDFSPEPEFKSDNPTIRYEWGTFIKNEIDREINRSFNKL